MLAERRITDEQMDDPALPAADYAAVLHDLAAVNRLTLAYRPTLAFLEATLGERPHLRLLDVGFGDGDMLRVIAHWVRRRGITAELTGIDLNPRSAASAEAATPADMSIRYLTGNYPSLAGEHFDVIVSSLVAHHMTETELIAFLEFMEREAAVGWFVNDLHRHGFAYLGFPILARIMRWHPIVRSDGQLSIARSFRADEWNALLVRAEISHVKVQRRFPFRLCVARTR